MSSSSSIGGTQGLFKHRQSEEIQEGIIADYEERRLKQKPDNWPGHLDADIVSPKSEFLSRQSAQDRLQPLHALELVSLLPSLPNKPLHPNLLNQVLRRLLADRYP